MFRTSGIESLHRFSPDIHVHFLCSSCLFNISNAHEKYDQAQQSSTTKSTIQPSSLSADLSCPVKLIIMPCEQLEKARATKVELIVHEIVHDTTRRALIFYDFNTKRG
jgi:hypothetical protein